MQDKYGVVYKITNLINNKVYIGATSKGFEELYGNINGFIRLTNNREFKEDAIKYGKDVFEVITNLDVAFSKEELNCKKEQYIEKYDSYINGYNKRFTQGFNKGQYHHLYTPIVLVNTMEVFHTLKDASSKYGVSPQNIYACCNKIQKSAGKSENGEKLLWRYANELDVVIEQKDKRDLYINSQIHGEFIYCVNTGELFNNKKQIIDKYNVSESRLYRHLNGDISNCGEINGEKLCFETEYKYLYMTDEEKEIKIIKAQVDYHLRKYWIIHVDTKNIYRNKLELAKMLGISRPTLDNKIKNGEFMMLKDYEKKYKPIHNAWDLLTDDVFDIKNEKLEYKYICLNTKDKFYNLDEIKSKYGKVSTNGILRCCNKTLKSSGRHPITNEKLIWMHYSEYKELNL